MAAPAPQSAAAVPGTRCPCGCNCAIPLNRSPATCPCPCGDCAVCGTRPRAESTTVGPQRTPAHPARTNPITVESAARTAAPRPQGGTTMTAPAAGSVTLTESQLAQLLAAVRSASPAAPAAPVKPLHEMTSEEFSRVVGESFRPYLSRTATRRVRED